MLFLETELQNLGKTDHSKKYCGKLIHIDTHIEYEVDQRTLLQSPFAWFSRRFALKRIARLQSINV